MRHAGSLGLDGAEQQTVNVRAAIERRAWRSKGKLVQDDSEKGKKAKNAGVTVTSRVKEAHHFQGPQKRKDGGRQRGELREHSCKGATYHRDIQHHMSKARAQKSGTLRKSWLHRVKAADYQWTATGQRSRLHFLFDS